MNLDLLNSMQSFIEVAKYQSFIKASDSLYLAPAIVTKNIQKLEQYIGKPLFIRSTRKVELTEAGEIYLKRTQEILEKVTLAKNAVLNIDPDPHGLIRIGIPGLFDYFPCSDILHKFLEKYPKIKLEVSNDITPYNLESSTFDLTISEIDITDEKFNKDYICRLERCIFAAPKYIKKYGSPATIEDLKSHNCLVYTGTSPTHEWILNNKKIKVESNYISHSGRNTVAMATSGLGLMWASKIILSKELKSGKLVEIKLECQGNTKRDLWIYSLPTYNPNVRILRQYLQKEFATLNNTSIF